ncbi:MerR family transcriptional regulator [Tistrella bauzanensis]|uniref:MerR family transcriptional regulator n=1 Tax=Tistrella bauzanensis TaxID=657419 RepID=A0ABQ1J8J1_9PROT|nr:MerR family transcriptional regulator [Tistrella bauzanensis]GGB62705.1 MerR family transcriptional regulator [Tistrella bauzanensis]
MRIGELARRAGMSASRIRFYEARGLLPEPERSDNGYRDYPESILAMLRLIDDSTKLGFSLSEIRAALTRAGGKHPPKDQILSALYAKLRDVDRHLADVTLRREQVLGWIDDVINERPYPREMDQDNALRKKGA